jgi:hypothetical protein
MNGTNHFGPAFESPMPLRRNQRFSHVWRTMNDEWATADVDIDAPEAGAFLKGVHGPLPLEGGLGRVLFPALGRVWEDSSLLLHFRRCGHRRSKGWRISLNGIDIPLPWNVREGLRSRPLGRVREDPPLFFSYF